MKDEERTSSFKIDTGKIILDFAHTKIDKKALEMLRQLVHSENVGRKYQAMRKGMLINSTE